MARQPRNISGSIRNLGIAQHIHVHRIPVKIQGIAPPLLHVGHHMDIIVEKEHFPASVIPSGICRKHILVFPGIGTVAECGKIPVGFVFKTGGLHEDRIRKHVHVLSKGEQLYLGFIFSGLALDYLSVLVLHRAAAAENGDTVLGVVIKIPGPEDIVVLVPELHHIAPELRQVPVDIVDHLLALEFGLFLDYLYIAYGVYNLRIHVP